MSETGQPRAREPGDDDDEPLPPGFIDELRRLDRETATKKERADDAEPR